MLRDLAFTLTYEILNATICLLLTIITLVRFDRFPEILSLRTEYFKKGKKLAGEKKNRQWILNINILRLTKSVIQTLFAP